MTKDKFWEIIDRVNSRVDVNNRTAIIIETKKELSKLPIEEIMAWEAIMREYVSISNTNDLWCACAVMNTYSFDDEFEYFRDWLISQGKNVYMDAIHNPDSLVNVNVGKDETDFESYSFITYEVLEEKNKRNNSKKVAERKLSDEIMDEIYSDIPKISNKARDMRPRTIVKTVPKLCKKYAYEHDMMSISI